jgi:hypothetical protein
MSRQVIFAAVGAAVVWVGLSAQQEMLPKPGPGSGVTRVIGDVNISNTPEVRISNTPDVKISNTPDVRIIEMPRLVIASPPFVRKNGRLTLTWADGGTENVTIVETGEDGWVQVEGVRRRWVNLGAARSVEER